MARRTSLIHRRVDYRGIGVLLVLLLARGAHADIYTYTSSSGRQYFSNVRVDDRYRLLMRSSAAPPSPTRRPAASAYDPIIEQAARLEKLPPQLLRAVIAVESGFDPHAVSHRGALGLMQLMPETARRYGVHDAFDPVANIHAGARYLGELMRRFNNDFELALAAYNAGEGAVEKAGNRIPPFQETRRYVPNVLRRYRALLTQEQR